MKNVELKKEVVPVLVNFDKEIVERLDAFKVIKGTTRTRLIEFIVAEYFKNKDDKKEHR